MKDERAQFAAMVRGLKAKGRAALRSEEQDEPFEPLDDTTERLGAACDLLLRWLGLVVRLYPEVKEDVKDKHPDHPRAVLEQRRKARTQRVLQRFVSLTARADEYYQELALRRLNPLHHVREIVALSEISGVRAAAPSHNPGLLY